jgi:hypothetical protein
MIKSFVTLLVIGSAWTAQTAWAVCSCTNLTVAHTTGYNQIICSATERPDFTECTERTAPNNTECDTQYEYSCPIGVNSQQWATPAPEQKTGFGVTATLTGDSTQCTSGQLLTLTITSNGVVEPNPLINPTNSTGAPGQLVPNISFIVDNNNTNNFPQFPIGGAMPDTPSFGGDNYRYADNATVLIERSDNNYRWWDNTDQGKDDQQELATWSYKFVSFVKGSSQTQTSCACGFNIIVNWPSNGDPTTTYALDPIYSNRCTF